MTYNRKPGYMKKWFFISLAILSMTTTLNAQFNESPILNKQNEDKKLLNWGYFLGLNQYDFKIEYKEDAPDILVSKSFGFNVGLIGELRINEFLDLRFEPGLHYGSRLMGFNGFDDERDAIREVKSTYINFPVLLYNYELGFGIDFYLEYFKFTPSIRGVFALTDELVPDQDPNSPWTGNIESLKTRGLFINFTFE